MTQIYCTTLDLVSHANKARLLTQLAGNDYGTLPTAQVVMQYMTHGTADTDETGKAELGRIKVRIEQAIEQSASEINGYLAMMPTLSANIPTATLSTINVDLAMARLFETLGDDRLANSIRQDLQACLNADDFEDFELDLMQNMVHFGEFSKQDFNTVFDIIRQQDNLDKDWQKKLVEQMKQDERFEPKTPVD